MFSYSSVPISSSPSKPILHLGSGACSRNRNCVHEGVPPWVVGREGRILCSLSNTASLSSSPYQLILLSTWLLQFLSLSRVLQEICLLLFGSHCCRHLGLTKLCPMNAAIRPLRVDRCCRLLLVSSVLFLILLVTVS